MQLQLTLTDKQIEYFKKQLTDLEYCVFSKFISEFGDLNTEINSLFDKIFNKEIINLIQENESEIFIKIFFLKFFMQKKMIEVDLDYVSILVKYEKHIFNYLAEFENELITKIKEIIQELKNDSIPLSV